MQGRRPNDFTTTLRGVRPGGGRQRHAHVLKPLLGAPEHLSGEAKEIYETIRTHAPVGLLAEIDCFVLEVFSGHMALHRKVMRGLDVLVQSERRANPLIAVADQEAKLLMSLAEVLGLSASSRQRIKLPEPMDDSWSAIGP